MPLSPITIRHIVVSLIIIFSTATTLLAQDSGTGWSYDSTSNTLTLSGDNVDWSAIKDFSSTTKYVVFADDYSVTSIPSEAFEEFFKLTAIYIPDVVTEVDRYAFASCTSLTSLTLPEGLTSLGIGAFAWCKALATIVIPHGVTSIRDFAFCGCTTLASVTLHGVMSIGMDAFKHCTNLTSVFLPEGLHSIGSGAFCGCTSLTSIALPASLSSIYGEAFVYCTSMSSVEILSNGTPDNKHIIYLGSDTDDKTATGNNIFPIRQATLIYDPNTTWIGDDDYQNLRYYFNSFASPTSIHSNTISSSAPHYFDLSGRPINPTSHKGIAVKLQDGQSSLITVK